MFSYQQISRWLSSPLDPVSIEDWQANREIFGPEEKTDEDGKQLEKAFQMESEREPLMSSGGTIDYENLLLILAKSPVKKSGTAMVVEVSQASDKVKKSNVNSGSFIVIECSGEIKLKVKCQGSFRIAGRGDFTFAGGDKSRIVVEAV